jgi:hypothetical protein
MIYQFIENLSRMIMEWAMLKRYEQRPIIDEVAETFSYTALRTSRVKKALL